MTGLVVYPGVLVNWFDFVCAGVHICKLIINLMSLIISDTSHMNPKAKICGVAKCRCGKTKEEKERLKFLAIVTNQKSTYTF